MAEAKGKGPASFRLPPDLMEELKRRAQETGVSAANLVKRYLDEGLRHEQHPLIVFRDGAAGRRAAIAGSRLDVGQVIDTIVAGAEKGDAAVRDAADYLDIPESHVRACVRYYAEYKQEVDTWRERVRDTAERDRAAWLREQSVLA
jgi:uncharacterized protein (DUF433 family)